MAKRKKKEQGGAIETTQAEVGGSETATMNGEPEATPVSAPAIEPEQAAPRGAEQGTAKQNYPDPNKPFSMAKNNIAGVELFKFDRFKQTQLAFRDKPPAELHNQLRQGGWTYRGEEGVYTKQYGGSGEPLALLEAKRLFNKVVEQLTPETAQGRSF